MWPVLVEWESGHIHLLHADTSALLAAAASYITTATKSLGIFTQDAMLAKHRWTSQSENVFPSILPQ